MKQRSCHSYDEEKGDFQKFRLKYVVTAESTKKENKQKISLCCTTDKQVYEKCKGHGKKKTWKK